VAGKIDFDIQLLWLHRNDVVLSLAYRLIGIDKLFARVLVFTCSIELNVCSLICSLLMICFWLHFGTANKCLMHAFCRTSFRVDSILAQVEAEHKKQLYRYMIVLISSVSDYVEFLAQYTNCLVRQLQAACLYKVLKSERFVVL